MYDQDRSDESLRLHRVAILGEDAHYFWIPYYFCEVDYGVCEDSIILNYG